MNPIVGFLATWIPVGFLLYNFYFTGLHIRSLWNPEKCDSSRGQCLCPAYDNTTQIEFDVYLSRKSKLPSDYDISKYLLYSTANKAPIQLSWNVAPFEETDENVLKPSINATKFGLTKNHTLYGHVIGYYSNKDYPNEDDRYSNIFTYRVIPLIYFDRPRPATYNLYDINSTESKQKNSDKNNNDDGLETKKEIEGLIVPYFVPNITIYYLIHDTCFNLTHIPPETYSYLAKPRSSLFDKPKKSKKEKKKVSARKQLKRIGQLEYYPILFNSDLTHLHKYAIPLMNSYGEWEFDEMLSFLIKIEPISLGFMRLYQTMEQSCRQMERDWEFGKADLDQIKSLFVDINPWLTLATFVAAGLHTIFSFLAMKSDITFWNASDRSLQGLSTNSVVFESISSFVILAYLIDSEQTNKIVIVLMLAECFLGLWKLKRIYTLKQQSQRIAQAKRKRELKKKQKQKEKLKRQKKKKKQKKNKNQVSDDDSDDSDNSDDTTDQDSESEQESGKDETKGKGKEKSKSEEMRKDDKVEQTESLDKKATRYMVYFMIPTIIGYSAYSFIYHEHKSILSFVINSMASCVYGLGFIHLTPQLFINYELKSVESLPWKVLIYRFFNTFVDDLFSLIIDMPTLHRLACFRDDVVFIIFCIQWWIYGAKKRKGKDTDQDKAQKKKKKTQ